MRPAMRKEFLRRQATVPELEAEHVINGIPFGFCNREWEQLKSLMLPGDEVWYWSTDAESWARLRGWEGIALVRQGEIVDSFITALS
jgi:hypothetical protein